MPGERVCNRISFWLALVLAAGIIAGILVPAGPGWDFANFYDAGHKVLAGQIPDLYNAFALIEGKAPQSHLAFYGTPISALLFAPLAWMSPPLAMIAFKIQATAAILLGLWLLYSRNLPLAQRTGLGLVRYRAAFLTAACLFQPFWTIYRVGGQTTPTLFLGFVLALIWLTSGRPFAAAAVMVAVVAIKPAFVLTLMLLAVMAGGRFFLYTVATGLAAAVLSVTAMGWGIHQRFLEHLNAAMISPWAYNSSMSVVFDSFRGSMPAIALAGTVVRLLAAGLVLAALLHARKRIVPDQARQHFAFLVAVVIGLLLMPIVWEHYLSVLFIPVAYWLAVLPLLDRPTKIFVAAICVFCCTQNLVFVLWVFDHLKAGGAVVQVLAALWKSAPLILFTALLARHGARLAETYRVTKASSPGAPAVSELARSI